MTGYIIVGAICALVFVAMFTIKMHEYPEKPLGERIVKSALAGIFFGNPVTLLMLIIFGVCFFGLIRPVGALLEWMEVDW